MGLETVQASVTSLSPRLRVVAYGGGTICALKTIR